MDRLTKHNIYFDEQHGYEAIGHSMIEQRPFFEIIKKLAEYEDTGLTPEEINKLNKELEHQVTIREAWKNTAEQIYKDLMNNIK